MFFPYLQVSNVVPIKSAQTAPCVCDCYQLLFSLRDTQQVCLRGQTFCCRAYDLFVLSPGCPVALQTATGQEVSFVSVRFSVSDTNFADTLERIALQPPIDTLIIRSCLLNILNFYALQPSLYQDSIAYHILSLLHYGHLASRTRAGMSTFLCGDTILTPSPNEALNQALNYIEEHLAQDICAEDLADTIHQSSKQVGDMFKYEYGCTVLQFVNRFRLFRAKELLCYTNYNITEISRMTGFKSIHYFSRYFKEKENMSPIEYKRAILQMAALPMTTGFD